MNNLARTNKGRRTSIGRKSILTKSLQASQSSYEEDQRQPFSSTGYGRQLLDLHGSTPSAALQSLTEYLDTVRWYRLHSPDTQNVYAATIVAYWGNQPGRDGRSVRDLVERVLRERRMTYRSVVLEGDDEEEQDGKKQHGTSRRVLGGSFTVDVWSGIDSNSLPQHSSNKDAGNHTIQHKPQDEDEEGTNEALVSKHQPSTPPSPIPTPPTTTTKRISKKSEIGLTIVRSLYRLEEDRISMKHEHEQKHRTESTQKERQKRAYLERCKRKKQRDVIARKGWKKETGTPASLETKRMIAEEKERLERQRRRTMKMRLNNLMLWEEELRRRRRDVVATDNGFGTSVLITDTDDDSGSEGYETNEEEREQIRQASQESLALFQHRSTSVEDEGNDKNKTDRKLEEKETESKTESKTESETKTTREKEDRMAAARADLIKATEESEKAREELRKMLEKEEQDTCVHSVFSSSSTATTLISDNAYEEETTSVLDPNLIAAAKRWYSHVSIIDDDDDDDDSDDDDNDDDDNINNNDDENDDDSADKSNQPNLPHSPEATKPSSTAVTKSFHSSTPIQRPSSTKSSTFNTSTTIPKRGQHPAVATSPASTRSTGAAPNTKPISKPKPKPKVIKSINPPTTKPTRGKTSSPSSPKTSSTPTATVSPRRRCPRTINPTTTTTTQSHTITKPASSVKSPRSSTIDTNISPTGITTTKKTAAATTSTRVVVDSNPTKKVPRERSETNAVPRIIENKKLSSSKAKTTMVTMKRITATATIATNTTKTTAVKQGPIRVGSEGYERNRHGRTSRIERSRLLYG